jgi:hypothetical protein
MATLYFNNAAADGEWTTLGNWWTNAACTVQAASLPTSSDSVVVLGVGLEFNSDPEPTVASLSVVEYGYLNIPITVTGVAAFDEGSLEYNGALTAGVAVFQGGYNASIYNLGTINGNATFNGSTYNQGLVGNNATFNGSAYNQGSVGGNATFNDGSYNYGTITGDALFEDDSYNDYFATVSGNATFRGNSYNRNSIDYNSGVVANRGKGVMGSHILGLP